MILERRKVLKSAGAELVVSVLSRPRAFEKALSPARANEMGARIRPIPYPAAGRFEIARQLRRFNWKKHRGGNSWKGYRKAVMIGAAFRRGQDRGYD